MTRIAVCSRSFSRHPVLRREVEERYLGTIFNDEGVTLAGDELVEYLDGHQKAIIALEILDADVFARLPALKVVSKYGVGFDTLVINGTAMAPASRR